MENYLVVQIYFFTLAGKGIGASGTARPNRKHFPKELTTKATVSDRVNYDYRSNGSHVWVDKWSILLPFIPLYWKVLSPV